MTDAERLKDAEDAYHALQTGRAPRVFVDQNGERVEYVATNASRLLFYIQELRRRLGLGGESGPMQFWGR